MKNEIIYKKLIEIEKMLQLNTDTVMDLESAAAYLKMKKSFIYSLTSKFEIPHFKVGKRLYFSKNNLREWLEAKRVKTLKELENERDPFYNHRFPWLRSNQ